MAGGEVGSSAGTHGSPRQSGVLGGGLAAAQFRAMQDQIAQQPTVAASGTHAYRIPRAVRADVWAYLGRRAQGS